MGWPFAKLRWPDTAFAQAVPFADGRPASQGHSAIYALRQLWHQPLFDGRAASGVTLLERHFAPGAPALVITEPDLSTEILIRAHRRNLIPINNPIEDDLIDSSDGRVRSAVAKIPAGTLLLTTPPPAVPGQTGPIGGDPLDFVGVQLVALQALHARFSFHRVDQTPDGLLLERLQPRRASH